MRSAGLERLRIALGAALLVLLPTRPFAQPAPKPPAAPAAADAAGPAVDAARRSFEGLSEAERKSIQDALVWTGDYNSTTGGTFGRRTYDAIVAYQRRASLTPTGILDGKAIAGLLAAAKKVRDTEKFAAQSDASTGITIGIPARLLPKRSSIANGTRWQSADGRVTLDLKAFPPGETDLDKLFERASTAGPERTITYKIKRPDFLVVSGETPTGRFYVRYAQGPAGIRGFTLAYDKAMAREFDRMVIAIANSFAPFDAAPPVAAAVPPAATPPARPAPAAADTAPTTQRVVRSTTGLAITARRVLTSASALDDCTGPTVAGAAASVGKRDPARNLVLLELSQPRPGTFQPLRVQAAADGEGAVILYAGANVMAVPGDVFSARRLVAPLQSGAAGAPVFDRSGTLVGLVTAVPTEPKRVAGIVPPSSYAMVAGDQVGAFLSEAGFRPAEAPDSRVLTLGEVAAPHLAAIVSVECGR